MSIYKILYKIFEHKDVNQNIYTVMYILLEAGASSNRKIRETAKVHMERRVYYLSMWFEHLKLGMQLVLQTGSHLLPDKLDHCNPDFSQ